MAKQFVPGMTYTTRSLCNYDCIYKMQVIDRTAKTIVVLWDGKEKRLRVKRDLHTDTEFVLPAGRYSMCPVIHAEGDEA